jgi:hypothetical protein
VLIKSSRAHSARHEFREHHYLVIIIAKKKRELSFVTRSLSLSLCSLSLSLCSCCCCCLFSLFTTKVGVRYKNKNSLPSSLSLVLDESIRSSSAQIPTCYSCVIKGLHEYFITVETCFFVIIAARCLFFVHTREREREREKKKEREERAKTTPTKILYLQNTRNVEKKQVVATAFLPRLERER